jgi:hypothetical protein
VIPTAARSLRLHLAALAVTALLLTVCFASCSPSPLAEEASSAGSGLAGTCAEAESAIASWIDRAESACGAAGEAPAIPGLPRLPPVVKEITEHVLPVLSTDDSHDIPNAAQAHDAELDREAAQGMAWGPRAAGPTAGEQQAASDLDESIARARARVGVRGGDTVRR